MHYKPCFLHSRILKHEQLQAKKLLSVALNHWILNSAREDCNRDGHKSMYGQIILNIYNYRSSPSECLPIHIFTPWVISGKQNHLDQSVKGPS